jgi:hypothetical protein
MLRSVLATIVLGVLLLSFLRRRKVLDLLVDVILRVEGLTYRVEVGVKTIGVASI